MKKVFLILILIISFTACFSDDQNNDSNIEIKQKVEVLNKEVKKGDEFFIYDVELSDFSIFLYNESGFLLDSKNLFEVSTDKEGNVGIEIFIKNINAGNYILEIFNKNIVVSKIYLTIKQGNIHPKPELEKLDDEVFLDQNFRVYGNNLNEETKVFINNNGEIIELDVLKVEDGALLVENTLDKGNYSIALLNVNELSTYLDFSITRKLTDPEILEMLSPIIFGDFIIIEGNNFLSSNSIIEIIDGNGESIEAKVLSVGENLIILQNVLKPGAYTVKLSNGKHTEKAFLMVTLD